MRPAVRRLPFLSLLLVAVLAAGPACDTNSDTGSGDGTSPTPITVTDTFTGVLFPNGAVSFSFTITNAGTVTVTLTELTDPTGSAVPNIGISLGSWDGVGCTVQTGTFIDNASVNASIAGTVTGAGVLCARAYDPQSFVTNPLNFTLTVTHP
jgi:hypothetical protein